jgi:hypothetical protein
MVLPGCCAPVCVLIYPLPGRCVDAAVDVPVDVLTHQVIAIMTLARLPPLMQTWASTTAGLCHLTRWAVPMWAVASAHVGSTISAWPACSSMLLSHISFAASKPQPGAVVGRHNCHYYII